jgi:hypothetical protein
MESTVDTQAVEHAVHNMANKSATIRTFRINSFSSIVFRNRDAYFELALVYGEGSQCATMTANGAAIAAVVAWPAQNAAIAGVAAFASVVSSNTTVGR